jgi:hypothetical protein
MQSGRDVLDTGLFAEHESRLIVAHTPRLSANQNEAFNIKHARQHAITFVELGL